MMLESPHHLHGRYTYFIQLTLIWKFAINLVRLVTTHSAHHPDRNAIASRRNDKKGVCQVAKAYGQWNEVYFLRPLQ